MACAYSTNAIGIRIESPWGQAALVIAESSLGPQPDTSKLTTASNQVTTGKPQRHSAARDPDSRELFRAKPQSRQDQQKDYQTSAKCRLAILAHWLVGSSLM
jgi:hypothetical protein